MKHVKTLLHALYPNEMQQQLRPSQYWSGLIPWRYFVRWFLVLAGAGQLENCKATKLLWVTLCENNTSYFSSSRMRIVNWTQFYQNLNSKKLSFIQFKGQKCRFRGFSYKALKNVSHMLNETQLFLLYICDCLLHFQSTNTDHVHANPCALVKLLENLS